MKEDFEALVAAIEDLSHEIQKEIERFIIPLAEWLTRTIERFYE